MDQSDIKQLTAIFAKLGYNISITKMEEKKEEIIPQKSDKDDISFSTLITKMEEKKEEIIPQKSDKDDINYKCVPIYMPAPINEKKCLCRLEKKGIPTQCSGNRLKDKKICTRHDKKMSKFGFYDDDNPPEKTSEGVIIPWKFTTKKVAVTPKQSTSVLTTIKPKNNEPTKDTNIKDLFETDSEENGKNVSEKKMSTHHELLKSLDKETSEDDDNEEDDEYKLYEKDDDLRLKEIVIDGISYTWYTDTKRLINKEHEYVGIWKGVYIEFANHQRKTDHLYHPDYKRETLIVGY